MEIKLVLAALAISIALGSYIPYFRDIALGKTKPHTYTWLVWTCLTAIAFFSQIAGGGAAGSWLTGVISIISFSIFILALKRGEKDIKRSDVLSLVGAFIAILFWLITNNPLVSIVLVTLIDSLGFYPTFRKSYKKPFEETLSTYFLVGLSFLISILSLENYSLTTYLYPLALVFLNLGLCVFLLIRRSITDNSHHLIE